MNIMNITGMLDGLGSNLLAEAAGIVVTVAIVDTIIVYRESNKWKNVRELCIHKIVNLSDLFLFNVINHIALSNEQSNHNLKMEKVKITPSVLMDYVFKNKEVMNLFPLVALQELRAQLKEIIPLSGYLKSPELMKYIIQLDIYFETIIFVRTYEPGNVEDKFFVDRLASAVGIAASIKIQIMKNRYFKQLTKLLIGDTSITTYFNQTEFDVMDIKDILVPVS